MATGNTVQLTAGGSILSQGGSNAHVTGNAQIRLSAAGVIGTRSEPIVLQLNSPGSLELSIGSQIAGLSGNLSANFSAANVTFANTPPGLVLLGGIPIGGALASGFISNTSIINVSPVPAVSSQRGFDGRYASDFPGVFNSQQLAYKPEVVMDLSGLEVVWDLSALTLRLGGVPPVVVPIPKEAVPTPPVSAGGEARRENQGKQREVTRTPLPAALEEKVGETPPTVVSIPPDVKLSKKILPGDAMTAVSSEEKR